jgi:hypothetical protein
MFEGWEVWSKTDADWFSILTEVHRQDLEISVGTKHTRVSGSYTLSVRYVATIEEDAQCKCTKGVEGVKGVFEPLFRV